MSRISDWFGYDVEAIRNSIRRLEVKTSVHGREHRVFLSRNEAEKAKKYQDEWFLVQVILAPEALTEPKVTARHITSIREVPAAAILTTLPVDSQSCKWVESVELRTDWLVWSKFHPEVEFPATWAVAGIAGCRVG